MGNGRRRPLKGRHKVKLLEENNNRLRFLSKDECQALVKACDTHLRPIVICALNTGMRRAKFLGLKVGRCRPEPRFHPSCNSPRTASAGKYRSTGHSQGRTFEAFTAGGNERPRRLDIPYVFYDARTNGRYSKCPRSRSIPR